MRTEERKVPIWQKSYLTLDEAAAYTGIGINKLRDMSNEETCEYVLWVGNRRLLKRRKLDEYLDKAYSV
jgi:excisionase family DNA binding protein